MPAYNTEQANVPRGEMLLPQSEVQLIDDLFYRKLTKVVAGATNMIWAGDTPKGIYIGPCVLYDVSFLNPPANGAVSYLTVYDLAVTPADDPTGLELEEFVLAANIGFNSSWTSARGWYMANGIWATHTPAANTNIFATFSFRPLTA